MSNDRAFDYQQQAHKPVVHYTEVDEQHLEVGKGVFVKPSDYPSDLVSNTGWALTKRVIEITEDGFETMNAIYKKQ